MRWLPFLLFFAGSVARPASSVLVLPFFNLTRNPSLDWIGESIAETVRESLAAEGVLTPSRSERQEAYRRLSVRPYVSLTRASVIKIADSLNVSAVLFGQFEWPAGAEQPAKGTVRITARLLDLKGLHQSPEIMESGTLEDLAALETHLAWQMVRQIRQGEAPSEAAFHKARSPVRLDARESYVRGLLATTEDQKLKLFTQAARLDARFSQPCYELGKMYVDREEYRFAIQWLEKVSRTDSHFYKAQFLLGVCRYSGGDYVKAETCFRTVAEAVPLNEVINNLAAAQSRRNLPEAVTNFEKALEGDSSDPDYHFNLGYALWKQGRFARAADSFRAALQRHAEDDNATLLLGRCLKGSGPRPGDPKGDGLERLKLNYEENAYRQLKSALAPSR